MPDDWLDPLFELELVVLLAVGVDEEVVSVPVELELFVEDEEDELEFVALGTVAATASEPAMPLAATIAVIVAVRALPCRTERAAPSASMALSVKRRYRSVIQGASDG